MEFDGEIAGKSMTSVDGQICQIYSDNVGKTVDGDRFVACDICGFPVFVGLVMNTRGSMGINLVLSAKPLTRVALLFPVIKMRRSSLMRLPLSLTTHRRRRFQSGCLDGILHVAKVRRWGNLSMTKRSLTIISLVSLVDKILQESFLQPHLNASPCLLL